MVAGWLLRPTWWSVGHPMVLAGALASAAGVAIFVTIVWRSVGAPTNVEFRGPGGG